MVELSSHTGSIPVLTTKIKKENMKKYLINTAIWYVLLSIGMAIVWVLTGISGFILLRLIIALILGYAKPFNNLPWKQS
jgi:hypothetical protein